ncbi:MAG TPA: sugar ABC transporter ATP-binding protein, partial [Ktedonobacteraceae bacterium]|nr:sugar ABC transporter ATP-binding protein [Ktedonobacteraceae bacterium]
MSDPVYMLEANGLYKSYGGIAALKGVDFHVRAGSVHALVGENGAGKSTLVKILVGAAHPDMGTLRLDGQVVHFANTADAAAHGIAIVSQELSLFPDLDVLANLFPMREIRRGPLVSRARMWEQAEPVLRDLGLNVDPALPVEALSLEQRQLLEIARALMVQPRVLILDEPTSALHAHETARLHSVLRTLRQRHVAVIYISHLLEEVLSLCDEVTVLRDGERVLDAVPASQLKMDEIIHAMLGEKVPALSAHPTQASPSSQFGPGTLRIEQLSVTGRLQDVTLEAPSGTIVGIAGLSGSGHLDLLGVLAGYIRPAHGKIWLPNGKELRYGLQATVRQGVALISGDRRRIGLMLDKSLWENIAQVRAVALRRDGAFLRRDRLYARARAHVQRLGIATPSINQ